MVKKLHMFNIARLKKASPYETLNDKELIELYRSSANQDLVAALFSRYHGLMFGVCYQYLKDSEAASDACNDIYIELVEKLLKYDVQQPKAWLHTLTRNHCLMRLRREKKMPVNSFPDDFVQSDVNWHPDNVTDRERKLNSLEECLDKLKKEQKQTVALFYMEQKTYNEIAEITGIEWNQIRSNIQNGRRNLKICMEGKDEQG
jgi:RNA polymerase sigma-70 factor (ECF subfamily)